MNAGSPHAPRDQPEKEREREREREKKKEEEEEKTCGDQAASESEAPKLYFSKGTFIPCLIHRGK